MLLSDKSLPAFRRAAAFTISHMLCEGNSPSLCLVKRSIILGLLHEPLQSIQGDIDRLELQQLDQLSRRNRIYLRPEVALEVLLTLLSNADPSPSFISGLISPILSPIILVTISPQQGQNKRPISEGISSEYVGDMGKNSHWE